MDTDIRFLSPEAQSTLTTPTTDVEIAVVSPRPVARVSLALDGHRVRQREPDSHRDPRCLFSDVSFGEVRKGEGPVTLRVTAIAGFERVSEAIAVELAPEDDSSGGDDGG
jgi:hypothetical protein